jgi:hypothetical protein
MKAHYLYVLGHITKEELTAAFEQGDITAWEYEDALQGKLIDEIPNLKLDESPGPR